MCGRFTLRLSRKVIADAFGLLDFPDFQPRYNIAPTQKVLCVRAGERREVFEPRWGLIPSWAKDAKIGSVHQLRESRRSIRNPHSAVRSRSADAWWWRTVFTSGENPTSSPTTSR